ncbi:hypothetical protein [Pseudanabaena sp. SR411]|uniref:hypothetical protein n=1 Tax=Pseudanabaena sp. SR411 TaxID=1980935 RepID=UPI0020CDCB05|nr:hypothetical protein [Pseudanabaena sp. SR411]
MSQEEFQKQVLESLAELKTDVERLDASIEKSDDKFDTYRQATQSLVNLAFGLIASATNHSGIRSFQKIVGRDRLN